MPRQITTFEFKLIGFLTLKQFIYLVVSFPLGFVVFKIIPIPLLNLLFAAVIGGIGLALAFVPVNDRPLDVWIKNLTKRISSATQYIYHKKNPPIYFLKDLFFVSDPHRVITHIESQDKLSAYLAKTKPPAPAQTTQKRVVTELLQKPSEKLRDKQKVIQPKQVSAKLPQIRPQTVEKKETTTVKKPFLSGVIKNHKLIPLPGILIYIKDNYGKIIRLLKTNPHGVFATFNPLPVAEYTFEFRDPKSTYFFDTIKLNIDQSKLKPLEFFSRELI